MHEAFCYVKPDVLDCQPESHATVNAFFRAADELGIVSLYGKNWEEDFAAICEIVEADCSLCAIWKDRKSQVMADGTWDINQGYPEIPTRLAFHQIQQALRGNWSKETYDFATWGWAYEAEEYSYADVSVKVFNNYVEDDDVCPDQEEFGDDIPTQKNRVTWTDGRTHFDPKSLIGDNDDHYLKVLLS